MNLDPNTALVFTIAVAVGSLIAHWLLFRGRQGGTHETLPEEFEAMNAPKVPEIKDFDAAKAENDAGHIPYTRDRMPEAEMVAEAERFYRVMDKRRTVRFYSDKAVPLGAVQWCIRTAGTGPSGAHCQPWTYVIVANKEAKRQIREAVEKEEKMNYDRRMKRTWVEDLKPCGTNWQKEYLEQAPLLVCVFKHTYRMTEDGERVAVYYPEQSIGISVGFFMAALHHCGLETLTSTPMGAESFIRTLLQRPENERLFLLMPVGYPRDDCTVPNFTRRELSEISAVV